MKKIKIFLFIISYSLFFLNVTNASVIPGTIKKGSNSTSTQCGISSSSYVTSNRCVTAGSCNRSCDSYHPVYHYCTSGSYKSSGGQSYRSSSTSYNNYLSRSNTIYYNGSVRLTSDVQTCTTNTTGVHSGASYGGYTYCSGSPCGSGGSGSRYNPRHGYCSRATSRETRISYFNQLGTRTYSKNNYATTQYNSSKNTNLTATCYIEGRYATSDTSAPSISVNGVRNVFANNDEERCNIENYKVGVSNIVTINDPFNYNLPTDMSDRIIDEGCDYYRQLNTTGNPGKDEDLLKGLEISVGSDISGIGEVQIKLGGNCYYSYKPNDSSLSNIIVSSTSPSGVKSVYQNGFTIKYDEDFIALGKTQPSLLKAFRVSRLDECLSEGKNSLNILTKDMARSTVNGTSLSANESSVYKYFSINVDNSVARVNLSGDLSTTLTATPGGFEPEISSSNIWRNYTLEGNIGQADPYKGGIENKCDFTPDGFGKCTLALPSGGGIYVGPSGVDPITGEYSFFSCGGIKFPEDGCEVGCSTLGYEVNPATNACEKSCVHYTAREPNKTGSEYDENCNYQLSSTAVSWYNSIGRCGSTSGIDYRNQTGKTKVQFDNQVSAICDSYPDLISCMDGLLCEPGDHYITKTGICASSLCDDYEHEEASCAGVLVNGIEVVLGITGEEVNGECLPYCIPSHSANCIVKEDGTITVPPIVDNGDWRDLDPNCDIADIVVGDQVWAGCNSTLGTGKEYYSDANCYNYIGGCGMTGLMNTAYTGCDRPSNEKEKVWNSTYGIDNIWGKLYTLDNSDGACPSGRHVPTNEEWGILLNSLSGTICGDSGSEYICDGLGWKDHTSKNATNNLVEVLKIPLAGIFNPGTDIMGYNRGCNTMLRTSTKSTTQFLNSTIGEHYMIGLYGVEDNIRHRPWYSTAALSVRCIKESTPEPTVVNGTCGSDNGKTLTTIPTNLCDKGTASSISGSGPWTWTCEGSWGGTDDSCSASKEATCSAREGESCQVWSIQIEERYALPSNVEGVDSSYNFYDWRNRSLKQKKNIYNNIPGDYEEKDMEVSYYTGTDHEIYGAWYNGYTKCEIYDKYTGCTCPDSSCTWSEKAGVFDRRRNLLTVHNWLGKINGTVQCDGSCQ